MASIQYPPKWGDSISEHYNKNGFNMSHDTKTYPTTAITAEYRTSELDSDPTYSAQGIDERIKRELINELIKKLYDSGYVEFVKNITPMEYTTNYKARINVVERKFERIVLNEKSFYVDGKEFNENKIQEALRNTYPEEFI